MNEAWPYGSWGVGKWGYYIILSVQEYSSVFSEDPVCPPNLGLSVTQQGRQ